MKILGNSCIMILDSISISDDNGSETDEPERNLVMKGQERDGIRRRAV